MNATDPSEWGVVDTAGALQAGEVSALQLVQVLLDRVAATRALNVFLRDTPDLALRQAAASDRRRARGVPLGPLDGVPVAVKDLIDVAGLPTTAGAGFAAQPAAADAEATARLRAAGAVILGKTHLHEWALGVTSANPHFGPARNPWDPARIPGGSSGGNAAGLSARVFAGAVGTDTGGSVRIPAACCGVVGLKPTRGLVPLRGVLPLAPSLDHVGPMARSVADVAALLGALAGGAWTPPDLTAPLAGLRVAVPFASHWRNLDPAVDGACRAALAALEGLGARLEDLPAAQWPGGLALAGRVLLAEAARVHAERLRRTPDGFGPDVRDRLLAGAAVSAADEAGARRALVDGARQLDGLMARFDLLATPTQPVAPPPIFGVDSVGAARILTARTGPFNASGHPALSLPCGISPSGLPVGLQLVGRRGGDAQLLAAAAGLEEALGWPRLESAARADAPSRD